MNIIFSAPSDEAITIDESTEQKLRKHIYKFLLENKDSLYYIEFKIHNRFSKIAFETTIKFIDENDVPQLLICLHCIFREYFVSLPKEEQDFYIANMIYLVRSGCIVADRTYGYDTTLNVAHIKNARWQFMYNLMQHKSFYITYYDKRSLKKDSVFHFEEDHFDYLYYQYKNLYEAVNNTYVSNEYKGVRKRKNSSKYYYRIKCKLPDGKNIDLERGAFDNPYEAYQARRKHLIDLTTQECENSYKLFSAVFYEFMEDGYKDKPAIKAKYMSYYNAHLKGKIGDLNIGNTLYRLLDIHRFLSEYMVIDKRSTKNRIKKYMNPKYAEGLKAMLNNVFDYAYNKKYIASHPMYQLPDKWGYDEPIKKKKISEFLMPLFAYSGNKHRLLPEIEKLLPKDIKEYTFYDLFCGSCVVGLNINAKRVILNDTDAFLMGIYKGLSNTPPKEAWSKVMSVVNEYNLSDENEDEYYYCRDKYNLIPYEERVEKYWYWGLALVFFSFNRSTVQHNDKEEHSYTAPFGKEKAILRISENKFFPFAQKLYDGEYLLCNTSYDKISLEGEDDKIFLYIDPPYYAGTATYNRYWSEDDEKKLYKYLEECHDKKIKWMLSNALENNGTKNEILSAWLDDMKKKFQGKIHVYYLNREYTTSNFRRKNNGKTVEIIITNY